MSGGGKDFEATPETHVAPQDFETHKFFSFESAWMSVLSIFFRDGG